MVGRKRILLVDTPEECKALRSESTDSHQKKHILPNNTEY